MEENTLPQETCEQNGSERLKKACKKVEESNTGEGTSTIENDENQSENGDKSCVSLKNRSSSLALLNTYDAESESDDDAVENDNPYQNEPPRAQSSASSSSSSTDSGTEESSDYEEEEWEETVKKAPTTPSFNKPVSELDSLPPIETLNITVKEDECEPIGKVYSIVDRLLVIESLPEKPPLMLDTVLFDRTGDPIGQIYDVFGPINKPFYSIRFNKKEDILNSGMSEGRIIYCAPKTEHTKLIYTQELLKQKGSDASWKRDSEMPSHLLDYSDDEEEKRARAKARSARQANDSDDDVVFVKEESADSPARKRYLSFEEQMNRNNILRNKAFSKKQGPVIEKTWDGGWHNYRGTPGVRTTSEATPEYSYGVAGQVATSSWNHQQEQFSRPGVFQFANCYQAHQVSPQQQQLLAPTYSGFLRSPYRPATSQSFSGQLQAQCSFAAGPPPGFPIQQRPMNQTYQPFQSIWTDNSGFTQAQQFCNTTQPVQQFASHPINFQRSPPQPPTNYRMPFTTFNPTSQQTYNTTIAFSRSPAPNVVPYQSRPQMYPAPQPPFPVMNRFRAPPPNFNRPLH